MSRSQLAPLCASCRSFILSHLPHSLSTIAPTRTLTRRFSVNISSRTDIGNTSSEAATELGTGRFLQQALSEYLSQVGDTATTTTSKISFPRAKRSRDIYGHAPITADIFVNGDPNEKLVQPLLLPLSEALDAGDLERAWKAYRNLMESGKFDNPLIRKTYKAGMQTKLFDLVVEKGGENATIPPPIKLANDWANSSLGNPEFYSRLFVQSMKLGELWQIEQLLRNACRICPPYQPELAYVRGQITEIYTPESQLLSESTIEAPQIELWVLIYAAFCFARHQHFSNPEVNKKTEWPKPGSIYAELNDIIPQMQALPTEQKLRDVLISHGFTVKFIDKIAISAQCIESANFFSHFFAFREDVKVAVTRHDYPQLKSLYEEGRRTTPAFTSLHYNEFILAFASVKQVEAATRVWADMVQAGINPTLHSWNGLLMGCGKSGDLNLLIALWDKMTESGVVPDTVLWTTRMHAQFASGNIRDGLESLRQMASSRSAKPNLNTINAAIDGLMKTSHIKEAQNLLEYAIKAYRLVPDIWTYNTLLRGYMTMGDIKEAFTCLGVMEHNDVKPDVVTCTIILNGLYKHSLNSGLLSSPVPSSGNLLHSNTLDSAPQTRLFSISTKLLQQMRLSGITANANFYTVLIDGLLQPSSQNIHAALDMLRIMQDRGIEGTATTYTIFVRYFSSKGDINGIEACWRELKERGIYPDWVILESTVRGYARMSPPAELLSMPLKGNAGQLASAGRDRERKLSHWKNAVVDRMVFWVSKVEDLNRGDPLGVILGDQQNQQQQSHLYSNQQAQMSVNHEQHTTPATAATTATTTTDPISNPSSTHSNPNTSGTNNEESDTIIPARVFFRLTMRTYKEVIGRLINEEKYHVVEHVLGILSRRSDTLVVARDGWSQLEGVLKVCVANGVRVPEVLMRMVFVQQ